MTKDEILDGLYALNEQDALDICKEITDEFLGRLYTADAYLLATAVANAVKVTASLIIIIDGKGGVTYTGSVRKNDPDATLCSNVADGIIDVLASKVPEIMNAARAEVDGVILS